MTADFGNLTHRAIFFGGPYGNIQALQALRLQADRLGVPPDHVICTGDVVAYCGDALETIDFVRGWKIRVIAGNVERRLALDAGDCGCNFVRGSTCERLSQDWFFSLKREIDGESLDWMRTLPDRAVCALGTRRIHVVHGAGSDISAFFFESTPWREKLRELALINAELIVAGHSGLPFMQRERRKAWINAGALGMPANDGTPRVWYAVLEEIGTSLRASIIPLKYDYESAAEAIERKQLPREYARTLRTGLWCDMSILPAPERARRGEPLTPIGFDLS